MAILWNKASISSHFRDNGHQTCRDHDLDFQVTWRHPSHDHLVTWRHPSHDHLIPRCPFPIGSPSSSSLYLHQFPRYWALSIFGSRPWPFRVTWRHQSCDHSTCDGPFPIGGHLDPSLYLLTVSEFFCPKHHVLIDKMLNRHCTCAISHDMYPLCKI